jgi:hypothetical protein
MTSLTVTQDKIIKTRRSWRKLSAIKVWEGPILDISGRAVIYVSSPAWIVNRRSHK